MRGRSAGRLRIEIDVSERCFTEVHFHGRLLACLRRQIVDSEWDKVGACIPLRERAASSVIPNSRAAFKK
jgi:hypothetical protein